VQCANHCHSAVLCRPMSAGHACPLLELHKECRGLHSSHSKLAQHCLRTCPRSQIEGRSCIRYKWLFDTGALTWLPARMCNLSDGNAGPADSSRGTPSNANKALVQNTPHAGHCNIYYVPNSVCRCI